MSNISFVSNFQNYIGHLRPCCSLLRGVWKNLEAHGAELVVGGNALSA